MILLDTSGLLAALNGSQHLHGPCAEVLRAANRQGLRVAVQVEPYPGRSIATIASDVAHLRALGVRDVYVYRAGDFSAYSSIDPAPGNPE